MSTQHVRISRPAAEAPSARRLPRLTMAVRADSTLLGGQEVFRGSVEHALDRIGELIGSGRCELVMTPNVDQVLAMRTRAETRAAYDRASLRFVDGAPLMFLARALGDHELRRIAGADLLPLAAAESAKRGWRVVITGSDDATAAAATTRLREQHPGASVDWVPFPHLDDVSDLRSRDVVAALNRAQPDVVFLCLGSPKQEAWLMRWEHSLPAAVYIGAGAAVDFAAGTRARAPRFVQRCGGEWLWRLAQEPRRLARRYLIEGPRFLRVIADSVRARSLGSKES